MGGAGLEVQDGQGIFSALDLAVPLEGEDDAAFSRIHPLVLFVHGVVDDGQEMALVDEISEAHLDVDDPSHPGRVGVPKL